MTIDPQQVAETELLHSQICQALDDPKRLLILQVLAEQSQCVTELAEALDMPQPTVSRHLKTLRDRGLVKATRRGPAVYYSLADSRLVQIIELLRGILHDRVMKQARVMENTDMVGQLFVSTKEP